MIPEEKTEETKQEENPEASEEKAEEIPTEENAAEEKSEAEDNPEKNCTTDEDDIAYVAERITGARHSVVTTAAPIRIRENNETMRLNSLSRIVNESMVKSSANGGKTKNKQKKMLVLTAAVAVIIIAALTSVIVGVNIAAEKNRPADINIGDVGEDYVDLENNSETAPETAPETEKPAETAAETDAETSGETTSAETNSPDTETEPETEPETQPQPKPEEQKFNVVLDFYDKDDVEVSTAKMTLAELLSQCEITLEEGEIPSISLDSVIAADTTITINKYEYKSETVSEEIPYESTVTETDLIPRGEKNYSQYGENGQANKYYTVEYINGQENSRTLDYEETVKYPVNEVYEEGVGGSFVGSDGVTYSYSYRKVVPATYYNIEGLTYLGTMADESVIAVDKDNIPLGTRLYVKNDRYDFGVRVASDIGGQVDEWEIDIWLSASNPYYSAFSREGYIYDMEIYYID